MDADQHTDIVFDAPPGPEGGRFVEVEDAAGNAIRFGEWVKHPGGYWALRIPASAAAIGAVPDLLRATLGAYHALRSYQHGNASTALAEATADACAAAIVKATGEAPRP